MEENKVVEFPNSNVVEQGLSPEDKEAFAKLEALEKEQEAMISDMVNSTCRAFDVKSSEKPGMPVFIPMESGLAITATYLNMISESQGSPIESIVDNIQELAMAISKATNAYYEANPEVPAVVYYYALIHAATSSLHHQRVLANVNALQKEKNEQGEE